MTKKHRQSWETNNNNNNNNNKKNNKNNNKNNNNGLVPGCITVFEVWEA